MEINTLIFRANIYFLSQEEMVTCSLVKMNKLRGCRFPNKFRKINSCSL